MSTHVDMWTVAPNPFIYGSAAEETGPIMSLQHFWCCPKQTEQNQMLQQEDINRIKGTLSLWGTAEMRPSFF